MKIEDTYFGTSDIAFFDNKENILLGTCTHEGFTNVEKDIAEKFNKKIKDFQSFYLIIHNKKEGIGIMEKIDISMDKFMKMKKIKPKVIHLYMGKIYKHSPNSLSIIETIDALRTESVFKHISTPEAYLYDKQKYFGYIMKYYKKLKQIKEAEEKGEIRNIEKFAIELLLIIEELNKLNLCYWDFHSQNILSDKEGHPFILDIDDMDYYPTDEDLHNQRECLTEFLLYLYLDTDKPVHSFLKDEVIQQSFGTKTLTYIDTLGDLNKTPPELPYCIIEELRDKEKRDMIKSKII